MKMVTSALAVLTILASSSVVDANFLTRWLKQPVLDLYNTPDLGDSNPADDDWEEATWFPWLETQLAKPKAASVPPAVGAEVPLLPRIAGPAAPASALNSQVAASSRSDMAARSRMAARSHMAAVALKAASTVEAKPLPRTTPKPNQWLAAVDAALHVGAKPVIPSPSKPSKWLAAVDSALHVEAPPVARSPGAQLRLVAARKPQVVTAAVIDTETNHTQESNNITVHDHAQSAQQSAAEALQHLEQAKMAYQKTKTNVVETLKTGKRIHSKAGDIKKLYTPPKPEESHSGPSSAPAAMLVLLLAVVQGRAMLCNF